MEVRSTRYEVAEPGRRSAWSRSMVRVLHPCWECEVGGKYEAKGSTRYEVAKPRGARVGVCRSEECYILKCSPR